MLVGFDLTPKRRKVEKFYDEINLEMEEDN